MTYIYMYIYIYMIYRIYTYIIYIFIHIFVQTFQVYTPFLAFQLENCGSVRLKWRRGLSFWSCGRRVLRAEDWLRRQFFFVRRGQCHDHFAGTLEIQEKWYVFFFVMDRTLDLLQYNLIFGRTWGTLSRDKCRA